MVNEKEKEGESVIKPIAEIRAKWWWTILEEKEESEGSVLVGVVFVAWLGGSSERVAEGGSVRVIVSYAVV